jgi:hypothetical protein
MCRLPGTWPVSHITITTAETHHRLPYCAHIHCLVSVNIQQALMNVIIEFSFFHMEEFNDTSASYALTYQTALCLTAPLLLSVAQ